MYNKDKFYLLDYLIKFIFGGSNRTVSFGFVIGWIVFWHIEKIYTMTAKYSSCVMIASTFCVLGMAASWHEYCL